MKQTISNHSLNSLDLHIIEPITPSIGTIIWLHGLGANNRDFDSLVPCFTKNDHLSLRFIFPNAPFRPVSINNNAITRAWYDVYSLTHLDHEDAEGIALAQHMLETIIASEEKKGVATDRIVLAGFSQGGAVALHTGLRYKKTLGGILALSCYLPLFHEMEKTYAIENKDTPIFIAHGNFDPILSHYAAKLTHSILDHTHTHVQWVTYDMAHNICESELQDIKSWLFRIYHTA